MKKCCLFLLGVVFLLSGCPDPHPPSPSIPDGGNGVSNQSITPGSEAILKQLGLSLSYSDPVDGNGSPVTGRDNPFGSPVASIGTVYEIASVGPEVSPLGKYFLAEHDGESNSDITSVDGYSVADHNWMKYPKKIQAGDVDGDGTDEVMTAVFNGENNTIYIQVQNGGGSPVKKEMGTFSFMDGFGDRQWLHDMFYMRDFTVGDFDNDGRDDMALSCMTGVLIVSSGFEILGSLVFDPVGETDTGNDYYSPYVRVEAGDINGDDYDDLIVGNSTIKEEGITVTGEIYIFLGGEDGLDIESLNANPDSYVDSKLDMVGTDGSYCSGEVILFDYDGNGLSEIALAGTLNHEGAPDNTADDWGFIWPSLSLIDPFNEDGGSFFVSRPVPDYQFDRVTDEFAWKNLNWIGTDYDAKNPRNYMLPMLTAGTFDTSGREMVLAYDLLFEVNDSSEFEIFSGWQYESSGMGSKYNDRGMAYDLVCAGDITGDGLDEIIYYNWDVLPGGYEFYQNELNELVLWGYDQTAGKHHVLKNYYLDSSDEYPTLALANVDDDTVTVEYLGYELAFSDPRIIAVMASAPYYSSLGDAMDISNSGTSYGTMVGYSSSDAFDRGFTVSGFAGFEVEDPTNTAALGAKLKISNSFSWSSGKEVSRSTSITYNVNAGYDQVIFAGIPIDVYFYRVLNNGGIDDVGEYMTYCLPRTPITNSVELSYYNSVVSEENQIPAELIHHTIGDPSSYYTTADRKAFEDEADDNDEKYLFATSFSGQAGITQGAGQTELSTEISTTTFNDFSYSLGAEYEVEAKVACVVFGYSIEGYLGYSSTHTTSTGTAVTGVVGSIEDWDLWNEYNFHWGLMMIPQSFNDQAFDYVTYWIEEE